MLCLFHNKCFLSNDIEFGYIRAACRQYIILGFLDTNAGLPSDVLIIGGDRDQEFTIYIVQ